MNASCCLKSKVCVHTRMNTQAFGNFQSTNSLMRYESSPHLASFGMYAKGGLQQVVHLPGDLHIQAWVGIGQEQLLHRFLEVLGLLWGARLLKQQRASALRSFLNLRRELVGTRASQSSPQADESALHSLSFQMQKLTPTSRSYIACSSFQRSTLVVSSTPPV